MGPGEDLFSAFGHAAICVDDGGGSRCYNYGTADFSTPLPLTWDFVRGRARFWVSVSERDAMIDAYERADRSVYRQWLPLEPAAAERLARALGASTDEAVKYYRYHHFHDNCTTRIRDLVDEATGGMLKANRVDRGRTFRDWARAGFASHWAVLAVTDLVLGRAADRPTDSWSAMFLPSELRVELAKRLRAPAFALYTRRAAIPDGTVWLGHGVFGLAGLLMAFIVAVCARLGQAGNRLARMLVGLTLGLVGALLLALAIVSRLPELRWNEALLAFWPTDLALPWLGTSWMRRYLVARLLALGLVTLGHLVGLTQALAPLLLVALPFTALLWVDRAVAPA